MESEQFLSFSQTYEEPKFAVIVIDPDLIESELCDYAYIGKTKEDAIRLVGANNIGIPVFAEIYATPHYTTPDWFLLDQWVIPPSACKSILFV